MYGQHVDLTAFKTPIKFKYAYNDYDESDPRSCLRSPTVSNSPDPTTGICICATAP